MSEQARGVSVRWWESVERHLAERDASAPDPWAEAELAAPALTAEQTEFLTKEADLDDQPVVPRLARERRTVADETGNSPGDDAAPPGVPSPP